MSEKDVEEYKKVICPICKHKNDCEQHKILTTIIYDRKSIRCGKYEYINLTQNSQV